MANVSIDPRCPWVQVHEAPTLPAWKLVGFIYEGPEEAGGNHNIYVNALDEHGMPGHVRVGFGWPSFAKPDDWVGQWTDAHGNTDFPMGSDATITDKKPRGPYWVMPSYRQGYADMVDGFGLPADRHVNYKLFYRWVTQVSPPPPPPPDGEPTSLQELIVKNYDAIPLAQTLVLAFGDISISCSRQPNGDVCIVASDGGLYWETKERLGKS